MSVKISEKRVKFASRVTKGGGGQGLRHEGVTRGRGSKLPNLPWRILLWLLKAVSVSTIFSRFKKGDFNVFQQQSRGLIINSLSAA